MAEQNVFDHLDGPSAPSSAQSVPSRSPLGGVVVPAKPEKPDTPSPLRKTEVWRMLSNDEKKQRNLPAEQNFQINEAGKIETVSEGGLTDSQAKAQGFYQRMRSSETQMKRLKMGPQDWTTLIQQRISPTYSRANLSDDQRTQLDLMENWIAASLRLESGAAIGADEFQKQARIFFPQPGAGEKEQAAKNQQRELAILGFGSTSGRQGKMLADDNLRALGFIDKDGNPIIDMTTAATGGAGTEGPTVSVSPEQSIAVFGEYTGGKPGYDAKGNIVGRGYAEAGNTVYDAQGKPLDLGLFGTVTEEVQQQAAPSFLGGIARDVGEAITGSDRATATTENLPDWVDMPELQQLLSMPSWKAALGTAFGGGPQEIAQIVQSNFPGTQVFQDEKGNYILKSPSTGQKYAIKPGFQLSDVPRALNTIGLGALGGGGAGATALRTGIREAGLQTGVEAIQAATGGTFNPEDIAMAGGLGAAGQKLVEVAPQALQRLRTLRGGEGGGMAPTPGAPVAPAGGGMGAEPRAPTMGAAAPEVAPAGGRLFEAGETVGGRGTAGAMSASEETIRTQRAAELPVPIELARFQRSRDFVEQQRARELAKNNEVGGPIRNRMAQQQDALRQNFERFIEGTGSQVWENPYEQGGVIADALGTLAKRERTKINALYKRAERAGEMREPVSYQELSDFISAQTPTTREKLAPVLRSVEEQLAANDLNKTGMVTLNQMEDIRKLINKVASPGTPDASFGRDMRGIIDDATKDAGGDVYRQARSARAKYARDFDDIDLVQKIYSNKPGSTERYVALEKVVDRITGSSAPLDSVNSLLNLLDRAGPRGERAKRELQGAVMEKIRDQAYRGVTRDESGGVVIQPAALNTIITQLDKGGKLDAIFDKKTAELLRTVNDVTKDIVTAPPGSINASGTSSAIMNAIDTVATYGTTGIPVPAAKILNEFRRALANRSMRKEVKKLLD